MEHPRAVRPTMLVDMVSIGNEKRRWGDMDSDEEDSELRTTTSTTVSVSSSPETHSEALHDVNWPLQLPMQRLYCRHRSTELPCEVAGHHYVIKPKKLLKSCCGTSQLSCVPMSFTSMCVKQAEKIAQLVLGRQSHGKDWPLKKLQKNWRNKNVHFELLGQGVNGQDENMPLAMFLVGRAPSVPAAAIEDASILLRDAVRTVWENSECMGHWIH